MNDQIYVNKYELIPENETNDENTTEYDNVPEETFVTKNLADFLKPSAFTSPLRRL